MTRVMTSSRDGSDLRSNRIYPPLPGSIPLISQFPQGFLDCRRLIADRRIRKLSLDSSPSGRPEPHCEAQLSASAPRSLQSERTESVDATSSWPESGL